MKRKFRYRRTSEIKMTNEARVLRRLRLDSGTTIKEVAQAIGKSEAYVRHIEHGRLDVPEKKMIKKILLVYGEYSNADFVGSVRPTMDYENGEPKVVYDFIPGPFALAIKQAASSEEHTSLLIEEINRGDAANIFGEIFQLLDRNSEGESEYSISVSLPFEKWLVENCPSALTDKKLRIPSNLSIVATMNSADQGVQTMDAAFKRRWRFLYMPVKFDGNSISNMKISYQNKALDWKDFAGGINKVLEKDVVVQEDRLIGPYFLRKEEISSKDSISEKLLLYLWNDVLRISGRDIVFDENITSFFEVQEHYKNGKSIFSETVHEAMGITDTNEQKV